MTKPKFTELYRDTQGGELNHEDLIDHVLAYVMPNVNHVHLDWERVTHVTLLPDGTVELGRWRQGHNEILAKPVSTARFTRMRDEARERDRINLAKLGKS